jgi:hypothetical protein
MFRGLFCEQVIPVDQAPLLQVMFRFQASSGLAVSS